MRINLTTMCANDTCKVASKCMRYNKYIEARKTELSLKLLNTSLLNVTAEGCEYLHIPQRVIEARGFRKMYGSIPRESSLNVWKSFPCCESRRQFYYMLSGDVPLLPEQQEEILTFFAARGADTSLGFDAYREVTV